MKKLNDSGTTRIEHIDGVDIVRFTPLEKYDFFEAAFSTRIGGVSEGEYSSMNLSFTRGDAKENVSENFRRMAKTLKVNMSDMIMTHQTHTVNVAVADSIKKGTGITREYDYSDIDGFVTDEENMVLVTSYADCVPVFFADPVKKVIASSHSGWRGTVGNISKNTVELMKKTYSSNPKDILAFIGPSICKNCYEVGKDVAEEFEKAYTGEECETVLTPKTDGKYLLDLHAANRFNLINSGLLPENIFVTDICTSCNSDVLFSHRKTQGRRGGMCGFIWKKRL